MSSFSYFASNYFLHMEVAHQSWGSLCYIHIYSKWQRGPGNMSPWPPEILWNFLTHAHREVVANESFFNFYFEVLERSTLLPTSTFGAQNVEKATLQRKSALLDTFKGFQRSVCLSFTNHLNFINWVSVILHLKWRFLVLCDVLFLRWCNIFL